MHGQCLCGAVSITIDQPKPEIDVCHCAMCRRWGGGAFGGVHGKGFTVEGKGNVTVYRSSDWAERAFCRTCGSNLWYHFLPADSHSFLSGLFDLPAEFTITQQIFVDEKPHWYDLAQQSVMKTGAEIIAEAEAAGYTFD
ncbi:GFA family protein [Marinihelvus fidelis]|uniref:GFA family protein n=1 Tax=Marinihelvus fidelis TaxID=2613842 RepID=A0A5N0TJY2_9GAMM|nr:GFA family protein [Marinihelvus fidelis]